VLAAAIPAVGYFTCSDPAHPVKLTFDVSTQASLTMDCRGHATQAAAPFASMQRVETSVGHFDAVHPNRESIGGLTLEYRTAVLFRAPGDPGARPTLLQEFRVKDLSCEYSSEHNDGRGALYLHLFPLRSAEVTTIGAQVKTAIPDFAQGETWREREIHFDKPGLSIGLWSHVEAGRQGSGDVERFRLEVVFEPTASSP
jgi:hypothetical protein